MALRSFELVAHSVVTSLGGAPGFSLSFPHLIAYTLSLCWLARLYISSPALEGCLDRVPMLRKGAQWIILVAFLSFSFFSSISFLPPCSKRVLMTSPDGVSFVDCV